MPELPEVQTVVNTLKPALLRQKIAAVVSLRSDMVKPPGLDLAQLLPRRKIIAIDRRAKRIIFTLDDGNRFAIHLGMSGRLTIADPSIPAPPHTHFALNIGHMQLRFVDPRRFGGIRWFGKDSTDAGLGPEPLQMRPATLARALSRTTRAIKNALLDQSLIAGLGNIYVDESLHSAGIHPLHPANDLSDVQIRALNRSIKTTLRRALKHKGSTLRDYRDANGNAGNFQNLHRVYHRAGKPCFHCQTKIEAIKISGRSTHFCPKCQSRPTKF